MNQPQNMHREQKKANTAPKINYQSNGRVKHSMVNTQRELKKPDVDQNKTNRWLRSTGLKAETKGLLIAAQDQSLAARSYHVRIIKDGTDPMYRIYMQQIQRNDRPHCVWLS